MVTSPRRKLFLISLGLIETLMLMLFAMLQVCSVNEGGHFMYSSFLLAYCLAPLLGMPLYFGMEFLVNKNNRVKQIVLGTINFHGKWVGIMRTNEKGEEDQMVIEEYTHTTSGISIEGKSYRNIKSPIHLSTYRSISVHIDVEEKTLWIVFETTVINNPFNKRYGIAKLNWTLDDRCSRPLKMVGKVEDLYRHEPFDIMTLERTPDNTSKDNSIERDRNFAQDLLNGLDHANKQNNETV